MRLSRRVGAVQPSPTLALNARARALAAKGVEVANFAAGEPDYDTPLGVKEAAIAAIRAGFTKYTATNGILELREAIAEKLRVDNGLTYSPDEILVSCGAKHALYNAFQALLDDGDEVAIFSPYWVSYPDMVRLAGGVPVVVPTQEEAGFAPKAGALAAALTPRTRAVILNSPSNPTGAVWGRTILEQIAREISGRSLWVVTDDIYEKLLYAGEPFVNVLNVAPDLRKTTVVVNGLSKAFSMTGWRLGYAAGPRELISAMQVVQDQSTSNASSITQKAGVAALKGPKEELAAMLVEYRARRDMLLDGIASIPGVRARTPEGAFFVFLNVSGWIGRSYRGRKVDGSIALSEILLEDFRVAVVPGAFFGAEGYLRLSFVASRPAIARGLECLRALARSLDQSE